MSDWAQYNLPGTATDLEVPANNVFPAELGGVFSGITQNLWGDTTPYEVRYTFPENGGCNMWGDECAIGEYPGAGQLAPLVYQAPVQCLEHVAGESPTGRCYGFYENFSDETATGTIGQDFVFGFTTVSEQTDGSLFYNYQQGAHVTANGYMFKVDPAAPVNATLTESRNLQLVDPECPGDLRSCLLWGVPLVNITEENAFPLSGKFTGMSNVMNAPVSVPLKKENSYDVEYTFRENCLPNSWGNPCGSSQFPSEGLGDSTLYHTMPIMCIDQVAGPNPTGRCFSFYEQLPDSTEPTFGGYWAHFIALSVQADDTIFWAQMQGLVRVADAILEPVDSDRQIISWATGSGYASTSVDEGEEVTFVFSTGHDLWQFADFAAYEACDFSRATQLADREDSPYTVVAPAGNSYYGCSVGSHCSGGNQKIELVSN